MLWRRLLYSLFLAIGALCAVGVLAAGVILAVRLSMLPKPPETAKAPDDAKNAAAAVTDNPRDRLAPEPFDSTASNDRPPPSAVPKPKRPDDFEEQKDLPPLSQPDGQTPLNRPSLPAPAASSRKLTPIESASGAFFGPTPADPLARPQLVEIVVPDIPGGSAIWGATGRDDRGRIWYGVTCEHGDPPSAHLMEMDPATSQSVDRGDVVNELKRLGLARPDEQQSKIHSKIVQAADGHLYFSSMDEAGELPLEGKPPTFGGHLWRLRLPDYRWEHLAATPEALIAVGTGGRYVYALGYFGHVLYQYDTQTGALRNVRVGSTEGHVSRNFLVDARGHAYVPRLIAPKTNTGEAKWAASLVEYDSQLNEIRDTPLPYYLDPKHHPDYSHGIIAISTLADGSLMFITHVGHLYRVVLPGDDGPAEVQSQGSIHPAGPGYAAALFTYDGQRWLLSVGQRGGDKFDWLARDLTTGQTLPRGLVFVDLFQPRRRGLLIYGSATRDFQGRFYLAGCYEQGEGGRRPLLLRVDPPLK